MSKTFYQNRQKNLVSAFPRCFCCSTSFLPSPFVYNALRPKNKRSSNPNIAPKHALKKSIFGSGNFQRLWRWFTAFFFVQNRGIGVCPLVKSRWEALDNQTDASKRFSVPCLGLAIIPLGGFYSLFSPPSKWGNRSMAVAKWGNCIKEPLTRKNGAEMRISNQRFAFAPASFVPPPFLLPPPPLLDHRTPAQEPAPKTALIPIRGG